MLSGEDKRKIVALVKECVRKRMTLAETAGEVALQMSNYSMEVTDAVRWAWGILRDQETKVKANEGVEMLAHWAKEKRVRDELIALGWTPPHA